MIRRLKESDREQTLALLDAAPHLNLYLAGNVRTNGFDQEFCEFWGDEYGGKLRGVVNRYMTGWSIYGQPSADWAGLASVIDMHPVVGERLQDNPGGIRSLLPFIQCYRATRVSEECLMQLDQADFHPQWTVPEGVEVRRAALDDLPRLASFYQDAEDMARSRAAVERPLRDRRIWMAVRAGEVLSTALTNAETDQYAMIGGVYTPAAQRGQGLARAVVSALCAELLAEARCPLLYWENPNAGRVYRALGFHEIGVWRSVWLGPRSG